MRTRCTLQYAVEERDPLLGFEDAEWVNFGVWMAKETSEALIKDETEAPLLWHFEGRYRPDLIGYFNGTTLPTGVTPSASGGLGIRIVTPDVTVKVIQIENPLGVRRTLIAHCAKAVN